MWRKFWTSHLPRVVYWDKEEARALQLLQVQWQKALHFLQISAIITFSA